MKMPVDFVAELSHVREVSIQGTADVGYWRERLGEAGLAPAEKDGRAQLLLIAASARFKGVAFRELSLTVLVSRSEDRTNADGSALIQAYNSSWLFAFCERVFFSTPYAHGDVRVSAELPASMELAGARGPIFRAAMGADPAMPVREPSSSGEAGWEGPVFLPGTRRGDHGTDRLFFARIRGVTRTYPFLHHADSLTIEPGLDSPAFRALVESRFAAEEWLIRDDAMHAKSKTYRGAAASRCIGQT